MADDLGYETLGVNGGTSYQTPHLDALAEKGMRFTHAYSTPLCTPSRVQLMTGRYNFRNYIGFGLLDSTEVTFAHHFKEAGYHTAVVGKWQLYGNARQRALFGRTGSLPQQAGFDEYCLWQVEEKAGPRYKDPYLDIVDTPSQVYNGDYGPDVFLDYIENFLERRRYQMFFLYYPMVLTHDPFQPTPNHPDYEAFENDGIKSDTSYFKDNVAYMDRVIGRIVRKLNELDLTERTLLLFIGDNGTSRAITSAMGDTRIRGNKGYPTSAGTHVPMIAYWNGTILSGIENDNLVDFTDFLPTLLDAANLSQEDIQSDGLSFYPQLLGKADTVRRWVFCHYAPQWGTYPNRRYVHDREWKLYDDGSFYHFSDDLEESNPIPDEALPENVLKIKQEFQTVLDRMHINAR